MKNLILLRINLIISDNLIRTKAFSKYFDLWLSGAWEKKFPRFLSRTFLCQQFRVASKGLLCVHVGRGVERLLAILSVSLLRVFTPAREPVRVCVRPPASHCSSRRCRREPKAVRQPLFCPNLRRCQPFVHAHGVEESATRLQILLVESKRNFCVLFTNRSI